MVDSKNDVADAGRAAPDTGRRLPYFLRESHRQDEGMLDRAMVKRRQSIPVSDRPPGAQPGHHEDTAHIILPPKSGEKDDGEDSFQVHCQTALNPHFPTNVSVHLDIPISKDLDDELEAFSRFKRLGDLVAAKKLLKEMDRHLDDPYILVQYADLLLDMGNYHAFAKLMSNPTLRIDVMGAEDEEMQLLSLNLELLIVKANSHRQHTDHTPFEVDQILLQALRFQTLRPSPEISATELRVVTLTAHLLAQTWPDIISVSPNLTDRLWVDWASVSRRLLTSHRDWEFRDFALAGAALFGQQRFAELVSEGGQMDYCIQWDEFESDVSATLAHLDLLVSLLQSAIPAHDGARMAKDRADAKSLASIVMACHPRAMRSRTFGHWLLVETAMAGREAYEAGARQLSFVRLMDLPKPVPSASGVPDWPGFQVPPTANEPIRTALAMAKEMEDYTTQAACHRLLAQRSCKPVRELRELWDLQATQGDRTGQHATCLARYYGCSDTGSQVELLNDLKGFESGLIEGFDGRLPEHHHTIREALQSHLMASGNVDTRSEPSSGDHAQVPGLPSLGTPYHGPEQAGAAFPSEGDGQTLVLARPRYGPNPGTRMSRDFPTSTRHLAKVQQRNDNVKIPSPRERPVVSEPAATRDETGFRYHVPSNPLASPKDFPADWGDSDNAHGNPGRKDMSCDENRRRHDYPTREDSDTDSSSGDTSIVEDSPTAIKPAEPSSQQLSLYGGTPWAGWPNQTPTPPVMYHGPPRPSLPLMHPTYPRAPPRPPPNVSGTPSPHVAASSDARGRTAEEWWDPFPNPQSANTRPAAPSPREIPSRNPIMNAPPSRGATTEGAEKDRQQPSNPVERPEGSKKSLSLSLQALEEAEADLKKSRAVMEEAFRAGDNARANSLKAFTIPDQERLVKQLGKAILAARAAAASTSTVSKPMAKPAQDRVEALRSEEAPESRRPGHKPRRQTEVGEAPKRASTGSLLIRPGTWEPPSSRPKSSGGGSALADKESPGQGKEETKPKPESAELTAGEAKREEDATEESAIAPSKRRAGKVEGRKEETREEQNDRIEARAKSLPTEKAPVVPEGASEKASEEVGKVAE